MPSRRGWTLGSTPIAKHRPNESPKRSRCATGLVAALLVGVAGFAPAVRASAASPSAHSHSLAHSLASVGARRGGAAALVTSLLHSSARGPRGVPYTTQVSCYTYRHTDTRGDTTGGIDGIADALDSDCVHRQWTLSFAAAQGFADNKLVLFAADIDIDGNLSNNCNGAEYTVAVGWVASLGALNARLFKWVGGCGDPGSGLPLSVHRAASNTLAVTFNDSDVASPPVMRWYDYVTGATDASGNQWDYMPSSSFYTGRKTASAAFADEHAPAVNGTYTQIVTGDFNGDGRPDLLFYASGATADFAWFGKSGGGYSSHALTINGAYRIIPGDFNGDGTTDLLFYAPGSGADSLWIAHHDGTFTTQPETINGVYQIVSGDFNGDGASDLFFYAPGTAHDYLWNGVPGGTFSPDPTPFAINNPYVVTAADMNGDGRSDLVLYAPGSAPDYIWLGQTNDTFTSSSFTVNGAYAVVRAGDFNGDGTDDLLFFNPDTGDDAVLFGAFTAPYTKSGPTTVIDERYGDALVGDFDGDGTSDVLFYGQGAIPERQWGGHRVAPVSLAISNVGDVVVDPTFGRVYVTTGATGDQLLEFDLHGRLVNELSGLSGADGMLLTSSTLYVALSGSGQIAALSHFSLTRTDTITTSSVVAHPSSVAITGGKLWFGSTGNQDVGSYDLTAHTFAASGIGITDSPWVYASDDVPNRLFVFGKGTDTTVGEFNVSGSPAFVGGTPNGGFCSKALVGPGSTTLYSACYSHFTEHDVTTPGTGGVSYSISGAISADVSAAHGGWVLAGRDGQNSPDVLAFRPGHNAVVHSFETSCYTACAVAIAPDGRTAFNVLRTQAAKVQLQIIRLR